MESEKHNLIHIVLCVCVLCSCVYAHLEHARMHVRMNSMYNCMCVYIHVCTYHLAKGVWGCRVETLGLQPPPEHDQKS